VTVIPSCLLVPFVYAGDVAEGIAAALARDVAIGRAYNLTGDDHSVWTFSEAWKAAGGRTAWVRIPLPLPFPLSPTFDHRRATTELGWENRPFVDGLRDTFARESGAAVRG
jgi:nucleoside-diphosphate-sugar epimerase